MFSLQAVLVFSLQAARTLPSLELVVLPATTRRRIAIRIQLPPCAAFHDR